MNITSQIVLATLRVHSSRAVNRSELTMQAGCSSRELRKVISELRRAGWLIVGDESGYRFAQTVEEVNQVITNLERQERSLHEVVEVMREAAEDRFGQEEGAETAPLQDGETIHPSPGHP